jgi:hypothetical protein
MTKNHLSIDFSAMGYIKDNDEFFGVIDGIYYSVVANSDTIKICIMKLMASERTGLGIKRKNFFFDPCLKNTRKFLKLPFAACGNMYRVFHYDTLPLLRLFKKVLKFICFSALRFTAIARSIRSFLKWLSFTMVNKKAFCSSLGSALKAVKNTSAVACFDVINPLLS